MDCVRVVRSNNDGIHTRGSSQVGEPMRGSRISRGLCHILAVAHIALGADSAANVLFHKDALVVVAVGVTDAVVALLHFANLVEARVGDGLRCCWEHPLGGCGGIQGVGPQPHLRQPILAVVREGLLQVSYEAKFYH